MQLNEVRFDNSPPVSGYGPGFFRVGGLVMTGAVLLLPPGPRGWVAAPAAAPIVAAADAIDVLLLGMGAMIAQPPAALRQALEVAGIGAEVMATPAACRTYNVLLAEGRRVGAALLPV
ncbi:MAG: Mth938-like domain-containing protein [Rhodobacteraceae bacterium]|nr:Mth938-like domain-containing protein [Paracoccaceae bacterium]